MPPHQGAFSRLKHHFIRALAKYCFTLLVSFVKHVNHLGPSFQREHLASSMGLNPLEGISAGLSFPLQCCHLLAGARVLISFTQCRTNCFHSLSSPLIQNNVTFKSVQKVMFVILSSSSKASLTCVISLASSKVARSCSLGIVNCFTGATLDLEATNLT